MRRRRERQSRRSSGECHSHFLLTISLSHYLSHYLSHFLTIFLTIFLTFSLSLQVRSFNTVQPAACASSKQLSTFDTAREWLVATFGENGSQCARRICEQVQTYYKENEHRTQAVAPARAVAVAPAGAVAVAPAGAQANTHIRCGRW